MLHVGCSLSPWRGRMSNRCRLFLREEGKALPFDRRRCRLDNTAAGEKIPGGGAFPIFSYNSSISFFWAACRVWTSVRCLNTEKRSKENELFALSPGCRNVTAAFKLFQPVGSKNGSTSAARIIQIIYCEFLNWSRGHWIITEKMDGKDKDGESVVRLETASQQIRFKGHFTARYDVWRFKVNRPGCLTHQTYFSLSSWSSSRISSSSLSDSSLLRYEVLRL